MKEYKIECKNQIEKSEVIDLLLKIGYKNASTNDKFLTIVTFEDGDIYSIAPCDKQYEGNELITLGQLRSMTKPKEYLFKGIDGTYKVVDHDCQGWAIEIPEGADIYINCINFISDGNVFYKDNFSWCYCENWVKTVKNDDNIEYWKSCPVLWSRHTKPEELPFVDDGPMTEDDFKKQFSDNVNHPNHYTSGTIECIDAIESSMTKEAFAGFLKGNVQKYMWRYENKGGVESLQKAQWYLNRLILLQSAHD